MKALVRIRIPLNRPQPAANTSQLPDDEEEENNGDGTARSPETQRSGQHTSREHQQLSTHPDEDVSAFTEQPIEDRVYLVNPISEATGSRVWVMHQAASRQLRKDMAQVLKKQLKELDAIEMEDFIQSIEAYAVEVEKGFVKLVSSEEPAAVEQFKELRQRFLGPTGAPLPTFDFELN